MAPTECDVCGAPAKYRCPACELPTCSVACVKQHKADEECSGKRARTEPVAPLRAFTDQLLARDFNLLEETDAAIDRAGRGLRVQAENLSLTMPKRHKARVSLAKACAAPHRQVKLILAPAIMALARGNTSRVVGSLGIAMGRDSKGKGKGKGKKGWHKGGDKGASTTSSMGLKPAWVAWRVDWHFDHSKQLFTDYGLPEQEVLGPVLERFLDNSWHGGATRHMLLPYAEAGLSKLEIFIEQPSRTALEEQPEIEAGVWGEEESESDAEAPVERGGDEAGRGVAEKSAAIIASIAPFRRLDKGLSLAANLRGTAVVEFPVLHVALPQELPAFLAKCSPPGDVAAQPSQPAQTA